MQKDWDKDQQSKEQLKQNEREKAKDLHPAVSKGSNQNEGHARDVGLVKAPIVTTHSVSEKSPDKEAKLKVFDDVDFAGLEGEQLLDLDAGQAVFVEATEDASTDALVESWNKRVAYLRGKLGEVERDENGDEIWDQVIVKERKKNEDGTFQMNAEDHIITGANHTIKPRLICSRNFVVKSVTKNQELGKTKVPADGIIVIRVY